MPLMTAGELIRTHRKRQGWTQAEIAEKAGLHDVTISRVESGAAASAATLGRISQALQLDDADAAEVLRCAAGS